MIKFENKILGKVIIRFRHHLPHVEVPQQNNSLESIIEGIKLSQGLTECTLSVDVDDQGFPAYEYYGSSMVHPSDHYKKETGRIVSLTRAVTQMVNDFSEAEGRVVMSAYYSR
jgi:hypothetical protein